MPEPADVHALTGALDDIVDFAEEAADQLGRYGVEASMEPAQEIADVLVRASEEVASALAGLHDGSDAGPHLVEIHRLENEADRIVREAVASLFVNGIDPMVVIRWKDIFESLEAAVDACETAANVLEGIALKRAGSGFFTPARRAPGDPEPSETSSSPRRAAVPESPPGAPARPPLLRGPGGGGAPARERELPALREAAERRLPGALPDRPQAAAGEPPARGRGAREPGEA